MFEDKAAEKIYIYVTKLDESIMDEGSSVRNANDAEHGKEYDRGTAILGLRKRK